MLDYLDSVATYQTKNKRQPIKYDKINIGAHNEVKNCSESVDTILSHNVLEKLSSNQISRDVYASNNIGPRVVTNARCNSNTINFSNHNGCSKEHIIFQEFRSTCSDDETDDPELDNWRTERVNIKTVAKQQTSERSESARKSDVTSSVWKGGNISRQNNPTQGDPKESSTLLQNDVTDPTFEIQVNIPNPCISCIPVEMTSGDLDTVNNISASSLEQERGKELKNVANTGPLKISGSLLKSETRIKKDGVPKFSNDVINRKLVFSSSNNENLV